MPLIPPAPQAKPTVTLKRSTALIAAGAIVLVGLVIGTVLGASGGSGDDSASQPTPTKTVTVEVASDPVDDGCAAVAEALWAEVQVMVDDVAIPQNAVLGVLISNLQYGTNIAEIQEATATIESVTAAVTGANDRVVALTPAYQDCVD
jgi:hypothetical protein